MADPARVVLTRGALQGFDVTVRGGIPVKADVISPESTRSEIVLENCIL